MGNAGAVKKDKRGYFKPKDKLFNALHKFGCKYYPF